MKILHICHSDSSGGAARAAYRLHCALRKQGQSSQMMVQKKATDDTSVINTSSYFEKVNRFIGKQFVRLQHSDNKAFHTVSWFPFKNYLFLKQLNHADIVHLHWFSVTPSIPTIGAIQKPVIWTLHDMWAFCGTEHYAPDGGRERWLNGYSKGNRPSEHNGMDIDRWTWNHKKQTWSTPFHIIAPSQWMADCVQNSALMKSWPCTVIPNTLDTDLFKPLDKRYARHVLNLPQDRKLILFGAIKGSADSRKGFDLLQSALLHLSHTEKATYHCVLFGQSLPKSSPDLGLPSQWMGHLNDEWTLALLYNAADVMVVPSRQENLPQTGTEAQACGCPVAAFNITGLPDVIAHKESGYLARAFEPEDLANGIRWILEYKERYDKLSDIARKRAVNLWSPDVVVPQYLDVYRQAIEQRSKY